jgi:hypothetical protein
MDMATDVKRKMTDAEIADAWAKITIKIWRDNLVKMKLLHTNQLWQSFVEQVVSQANGDLTKIEFAFRYYGRFLDMGVGRGTPIGSVRENRTSRFLEGKMIGNRRVPKKWYSRALAAEVFRLKEITQEEYGFRGRLAIVENMDDNAISFFEKKNGISNK